MSRSAGGSRKRRSQDSTRRRRRSDATRRPSPTEPESRLHRVLRVGLIGAIIGVLMVTGMFVLAYRATTIPDPNQAFQAQTTKVFYADGKREIGRFATQNRVSIPLADIPKVMQEAVVAAEDRTFWTNRGIDPKGIIRAAFSNAAGGTTQGASTITQQYVKLLYLTQERTWSRKIKEAFLSLKLQQQQSKSQILEGYLNTVYFGRGAYGVQAAANAFFGIPAKKLNVRQAAMLAAVLNSPNSMSPDRDEAAKDRLRSRYRYVLSSMAKEGYVESATADKAARRLPKISKRSTDNRLAGQRGFMLDMVRKELQDLGFDDAEIEGGGLRVTTTFTQKAMDAARNAVLEQRPPGLSDKELHVGVVSLDVATSAVLGFYSGQNYLQSQLNWALQRDSSGSAFKPFAVAAALKDGFSLQHTFQGNSPYVLADGSRVRNQGSGSGTSYGSRVSLLRGTQDSINTVFIDVALAMEDGPEKIRQMAIDLGIPDSKDLDSNTGIALGSAPVRPIDVANGYATIANDGEYHPWHVIARVTRASDGEVLYRARTEGKQVVDVEVARDTSYAMQQVVRAGTGRTVQSVGRPAAGKTGTATDHKDHVVTSWFVGYTPQVVTAVMYARGDGRQPLDGYLPSFFGSAYPARTWTATMRALLEGEPSQAFPAPAHLSGDAPKTGHEPYVPPEEPDEDEKPQKKKDKPKKKNPKPDRPQPPPKEPEKPEPPPSKEPPDEEKPPDKEPGTPDPDQQGVDPEGGSCNPVSEPDCTPVG